jgi:hypothetical protein
MGQYLIIDSLWTEEEKSPFSLWEDAGNMTDVAVCVTYTYRMCMKGTVPTSGRVLFGKKVRVKASPQTPCFRVTARLNTEEQSDCSCRTEIAVFHL